jgi:hypothetical protein
MPRSFILLNCGIQTWYPLCYTSGLRNGFPYQTVRKGRWKLLISQALEMQEQIARVNMKQNKIGMNEMLMLRLTSWNRLIYDSRWCTVKTRPYLYRPCSWCGRILNLCSTGTEIESWQRFSDALTWQHWDFPSVFLGEWRGNALKKATAISCQTFNNYKLVALGWTRHWVTQTLKGDANQWTLLLFCRKILTMPCTLSGLHNSSLQ